MNGTQQPDRLNCVEKPTDIRKAYYLCGCTREYTTDDVPKHCPCCAFRMSLTRIVRFMAIRDVFNDIPYYPEAGIREGMRDSWTW
jgi:hypothetical protein